MIRIRKSIRIDRGASSVFALVDAPERYSEFLSGITKWELLSDKKRGVGARYRVLMKVGSIEAGGIVRVDEWEKDRVIAWTYERGIHQQGRWVLRSTSPDVTELDLEISFDLSGGPVGALVERIAGRIVGRNIWATLLGARRLIEME